jgi:Group II intron, maturase-specific domain
MTNVTRFPTRRLKVQVNEAKSAVARPVERKFLGFSFSNNKEPKRRIAPKAVLRCKQKIRELTQRTRGISLEQMLKELAAYLRGWKSYFGFCQTPRILRNLDYWIRRRLRSMISLTVPHWLSRYPMLTSPRLDFHPCLTVQRNPLNRPMRTRMSGGVAGESGRPLPLCRLSPRVWLRLECWRSLLQARNQLAPSFGCFHLRLGDDLSGRRILAV